MKTTTMILAVLLATATSAIAQENELSKKFGFGGHLNKYQNDFGLGVNFSTPYFMRDQLTVRVRTNMAWNQHLDSFNETTWTSYSSVSLGCASVAGYVGESIRLYGEGGVLILFPSEEFSSSGQEIGGYGLFGFEFFMNEHANYFIELGGVGTGANASNVPTSPIYSNGFLTSVGFRYQL